MHWKNLENNKKLFRSSGISPRRCQQRSSLRAVLCLSSLLLQPSRDCPVGRRSNLQTDTALKLPPLRYFCFSPNHLSHVFRYSVVEWCKANNTFVYAPLDLLTLPRSLYHLLNDVGVNHTPAPDCSHEVGIGCELRYVAVVAYGVNSPPFCCLCCWRVLMLSYDIMILL